MGRWVPDMIESAGALRALKAEIAYKQSVIAELQATIERYVARIDPSAPQEEFVTTIAANMARFYTGVEDVLEQILKAFDDFQPVGADCHSSVLVSAIAETPTRPAIIGRHTLAMLDEMRSFRHIVHKAHSKPFDWSRMAHLASALGTTSQLVAADLARFDAFLDSAIAAVQ